LFYYFTSNATSINTPSLNEVKINNFASLIEITALGCLQHNSPASQSTESSSAKLNGNTVSMLALSSDKIIAEEIYKLGSICLNAVTYVNVQIDEQWYPVPEII
jgi:hypothetical protein